MEGSIDNRHYPTKPIPKGYVAFKTSVAPPMNGKLEGPWEQAPWTDAFQDIEGPSKPAPRLGTRVKMLWDDRALYIGAWLEEPAPWAALELHDSIIYQDNDFEVFIDPDGDNHMYYEFEVNAHGAWWDLFLVRPYRDGGPALHSFEAVAPSEPTQLDGPTGWEPAQRAVWVDGELNNGDVTSRGWGVEISLPWSLLRQAAMRDTPPRPGHQWRINFSRVQWQASWDPATRKYTKVSDTREDNWVWSPQWAVAMHMPELWGYLQFSDTDVNSLQHPDTASALDAFVPDPTWPLRSFLMEVYYAQKKLWDATGEFACSLQQLGLPPLPPHVGLSPRVQCTEASFTASAQLPPDMEEVAAHQVARTREAAKVTRMYVNEEGRLVSRSVKASV